MESDNWFLALIYNNQAEGKAVKFKHLTGWNNHCPGFVEQHSQNTIGG